MNATTRTILGTLLEWQTAYEAGDSTKATRLLQQALDLDDGTDSDARTKHGMLYRHAIALDQNDGTTRYAFAQHLWRTKRAGQARTEIQEAHRLGHPKALSWLAKQEAALIET